MIDANAALHDAYDGCLDEVAAVVIDLLIKLLAFHGLGLLASTSKWNALLVHLRCIRLVNLVLVIRSKVASSWFLCHYLGHEQRNQLAL